VTTVSEEYAESSLPEEDMLDGEPSWRKESMPG
jgi:hypothetical protein